MFPNAPNALIHLLTVTSILDSLGVKSYKVTESKEVVGIVKSITSLESKESASMNKTYDIKVSIVSFLYNEGKFVLYKNEIYKVERSFYNGEFVELYLSKSDLKVEDITW